MAPSLCPSILSRRGLLALLWSCINICALIALVLAIIFSTRHMGRSNYYYNNNNNDNYNDDDYVNNYNQNNNRDCDEDGEDGGEGCGSQDNNNNESNSHQTPTITLTGMAFVALWTTGLATLMSIYGTMILGFQDPITGDYYKCCSSSFSTKIGFGTFLGSLLMLANVTFVSSVLFGEYRNPYYYYAINNNDDEGDGDGNNEQNNEDNKNDNNNFKFDQAYEEKIEQSAFAFSIVCMFLSVMYAGFAIITYVLLNNEVEVSNNSTTNNNNTTAPILPSSPSNDERIK